MLRVVDRNGRYENPWFGRVVLCKLADFRGDKIILYRGNNPNNPLRNLKTDPVLYMQVIRWLAIDIEVEIEVKVEVEVEIGIEVEMEMKTEEQDVDVVIVVIEVEITIKMDMGN